VEDLSISVYDHEDDDELRIDFDAHAECYSPADLEDHQQRFLRLLKAAFEKAERPIGLLPVLSAAERTTIVEQWNATAHAVPQTTLPQLFSAQASRTPDAVAVVCED